MAVTTYTFTKTPVNADRLTLEINASSIVIALDHITINGDASDNLDVLFKDVLSSGDEATLDTVVANHNGTPLPPEPMPVQVENTQLEVVPTSPKNEYQLNPLGLHARRFNRNDYLGSITLSDKVGATYTFTKTLTADLIHEDCIWYFDTDGYFVRVYVVSYSGNSVTLSSEVPEGTYKLSRKFIINYSLTNQYDFWHLWGAHVTATNPGKYDWIVLEIMNPETGEEVKRYDEVWVNQINALTKELTPDGAPGVIPYYLPLRIDYYYATDDSTDDIVKIDYILSSKDY